MNAALAGQLAALALMKGGGGLRLDSVPEFCEHDGVIEEEQVSFPGLGAHADLNTLLQQQLSVLATEAKDEWTLLRGHPAGGFLPKNSSDGCHVTHDRRQEQKKKKKKKKQSARVRTADLLLQNVRRENKCCW